MWCDDGWAYVPKLKIRFRHINASEEYDEVYWPEVIPAKVEYEETVKWTLYKQKPKIWKEETENYCELFVENG